jgi:hypothetical protein
MTKQEDAADIEQFAISLTDKCEDHEAWLAIVRFGLGTFMENQALMIEVIAREAAKQIDRKQIKSLVIADELRFIFQELGLRLTAQPSDPQRRQDD